jgi:hypothetical protein
VVGSQPDALARGIERGGMSTFKAFVLCHQAGVFCTGHGFNATQIAEGCQFSLFYRIAERPGKFSPTCREMLPPDEPCVRDQPDQTGHATCEDWQASLLVAAVAAQHLKLSLCLPVHSSGCHVNPAEAIQFSLQFLAD